MFSFDFRTAMRFFRARARIRYRLIYNYRINFSPYLSRRAPSPEILATARRSRETRASRGATPVNGFYK